MPRFVIASPPIVSIIDEDWVVRSVSRKPGIAEREWVCGYRIQDLLLPEFVRPFHRAMEAITEDGLVRHRVVRDVFGQRWNNAILREGRHRIRLIARELSDTSCRVMGFPTRACRVEPCLLREEPTRKQAFRWAAEWNELPAIDRCGLRAVVI